MLLSISDLQRLLDEFHGGGSAGVLGKEHELLERVGTRPGTQQFTHPGF